MLQALGRRRNTITKSSSFILPVTERFGFSSLRQIAVNIFLYAFSSEANFVDETVLPNRFAYDQYNNTAVAGSINGLFEKVRGKALRVIMPSVLLNSLFFSGALLKVSLYMLHSPFARLPVCALTP